MIDADVRATFAAIALAHQGDRAVAGLFDHSLRRAVNITAVFDGLALTGVDIDRRSRLVGKLPEFFDEVRGAYVHVAPDGDRYIGYDHKTGTHLHIVIKDETANLYDHSAAQWFQFSLKTPDAVSSL